MSADKLTRGRNCTASGASAFYSRAAAMFG